MSILPPFPTRSPMSHQTLARHFVCLAIAALLIGSCSDQVDSSDAPAGTPDRGGATVSDGDVGQAKNDPPGSQPTGADGPQEHAAGVRWDSTEHDFGVIRDDGGKVTASFRFTNTSDEPRTITKINCKCGCTAPSGEGVYQPGESGEIKITYDPTNRQGPDIRTCVVETDAKAAGTAILTIRANVDAAIAVEPRAMWIGEFEKGQGGKTVKINVTARDPEFDIAGISVRTKDFKAEDGRFSYKTLGKSKVTVGGIERTRHSFEVTFLGDDQIGRVEARVALDTNQSNKPQIVVPLVASVHGPLRVMPDILTFAIDGPGKPFSKEVRISHRDLKTAFDLKDLTATGPDGMELKVEEVPNGTSRPTEHLIRITGVGPKPTKEHGNSFKGSVQITTSLANQPLVTIPMSGNVRLSKQASN